MLEPRILDFGTNLGEKAYLPASPEAFFEKCKGFSSDFFMGLYTRFIWQIEPNAPTQYCREVAHLQKKFSTVVIFDGSRLDKIAHRLKILWSEKAAVLPGCLLAVYDIFRSIATQLWFDADAAASEHDRAMRAAECLGSGTLAMGDRLYCTLKFFRQLNEKECFGLFRRNKTLSFKKIRRLRRLRRNRAIIEDLLVKAGTGENAMELRLIRLKVGGKTYEAFTNILDMECLTAEDIVTLYPLRWRVEQLNNSPSSNSRGSTPRTPMPWPCRSSRGRWFMRLSESPRQK